jgi:hypothetical protein
VKGLLSGALLGVCGALMVLLGAGLFLGNVTGLFPTFPFAGFLVMTAGGLLFGVGKSAMGGDSPS